MPASVTPIASTTATTPAGMASITARVEIGRPQEAGVARSSHAGTKRSVKAQPTRRCGGAPAGVGVSALAPRSQGQDCCEQRYRQRVPPALSPRAAKLGMQSDLIQQPA